jgi:hypothetical protein
MNACIRLLVQLLVTYNAYHRLLWSVGCRVERHDGQGRSCTNMAVVGAEFLFLFVILPVQGADEDK